VIDLERRTESDANRRDQQQLPALTAHRLAQVEANNHFDQNIQYLLCVLCLGYTTCTDVARGVMGIYEREIKNNKIVTAQRSRQKDYRPISKIPFEYRQLSDNPHPEMS